MTKRSGPEAESVEAANFEGGAIQVRPPASGGGCMCSSSLRRRALLVKSFCVNLDTNKSPFTHPHHHQNAGRPAGTLASPRSQGSGTSATGAGKCRLRFGAKEDANARRLRRTVEALGKTKLSPKVVVQLPRVSDVLTASETVNNRTLHGFHMPGTERDALQHGHATTPRKLWASRPSSPRRRIPVVTLYHS